MQEYNIGIHDLTQGLSVLQNIKAVSSRYPKLLLQKKKKKLCEVKPVISKWNALSKHIVEKKQEIDQRFVKKKILHKNYYKKVHAVGMYSHFLLVFP